MCIDKVAFISAMTFIHKVSNQKDEQYNKIAQVIGDSETIMEWLSVGDMVKLLERVALDNHGFISTFIFENNWGTYNLALRDKVLGITLPFRTCGDLYDILQYPQPWNLEVVEA